MKDIPGEYIRNLYDAIQANSTDFEAVQLQEWKGEQEPAIVYHYETVTKIRGLAYTIFALIFFPLHEQEILHALVGKLIFIGWMAWPASQRESFIIKPLSGEEASHSFLAVNRQQLVVKRIHVLVNGKKVDAFIYGRRDTIHNGVWTLISKGVGDCMEIIGDYELEEHDPLKSNYLFFNYPGVGASEGLPYKEQVINTHKAMLRFLEDSRGIGAKKVMCWGRSIGGAVQGESVRGHEFQDDIEYTFVQDRVFSLLTDVSWITYLLKSVGWQFDCVESSEELEKAGKQEIILQTAHEETFDLNQDEIRGDGLLSISNTLAYALLAKKSDWKHKKFIGLMPDLGHYGFTSRMHAGVILAERD